MHTIEEFKQRQLDALAGALTRPGMCCPTDFGANLYFSRVVSDLCWIDNRENDWKQARDRIRNSNGVYGQLRDQPVRLPEYGNEIASCYAEIAHGLGYFQPARSLSGAEWASVRAALDKDFFSCDWRESDLHARFGCPSHEVVGGLTTVVCYAPEDQSEAWVFFDLTRRYPHADEWLPDPVVRDVRTRSNVFHLMPSADWCRRCEVYFHPASRPGDIMHLSVVSLEGNHLSEVPELLRQFGYRIEESFLVHTGDQVSKEIVWLPGGCQTAKAAYIADGWTHILDPEMSLASWKGWLNYTEKRESRLIAWGCFIGTYALTVIQAGKRLRDVVYCGGHVVVDRGTPLPEERAIDWRQADDDDVLTIAERLGVPYTLIDREYVVFRLDDPRPAAFSY